MTQDLQVLKRHYVGNLEKASPEARDILTGKRKLDYSKECLLACKVCKLTTVHVKGKKDRKISGISGVRYVNTKTCKECGTEVAF